MGEPAGVRSEMCRLSFERSAAAMLDLDSALSEAGCTHPTQSCFSHWRPLPGDPYTPGPHKDLVLGLRRWKHLAVVVPTAESIHGSNLRLTPDDVFADELLDLIVPST